MEWAIPIVDTRILQYKTREFYLLNTIVGKFNCISGSKHYDEIAINVKIIEIIIETKKIQTLIIQKKKTRN